MFNDYEASAAGNINNTAYRLCLDGPNGLGRICEVYSYFFFEGREGKYH
jgi:hypothetical protein